jgi:hypothetical protein
LQVGDTGPVESARRSNSRVLGSPFSGLSGHLETIQKRFDLVCKFLKQNRTFCCLKKKLETKQINFFWTKNFEN